MSSDSPQIRLLFRRWSGIVADLMAIIFLLVMIAILLKLGLWQMARYHEKQGVLNHYYQQMSQPPVADEALEGPLEALEFRQILLKGHFDNQKSFFLDNRTYQGKVGYDVLTPFVLADSDHTAVLVDRGWLSLGRDRQSLPLLLPIVGEVQITGVVTKAGAPPLLSEGAEVSTGWPKRIPAVNWEDMTHQLGYDLKRVVVQLSPDSPYGYQRHWQPLRVNPERHLGYAFQWFGLAVVVLVMGIFYFFTTHRSEG